MAALVASVLLCIIIDAKMSVVQYGTHPLQSIKVMAYDEANHTSLVLIHGGGWRDPNNTYDDFVELVHHLGPTGFNVFGVNYRLSPQVKHPEHLVDVVSALNHLHTEYKVDSVVLVGHSVGGTLLMQLLNHEQLIRRAIVPIEAVDSLQVKLDKLVFVDGIYDVVEMLREYPSYRSFVDDAFVSQEHYTQASQVSAGIDLVLRPDVVLVHSLEDELLSPRQTKHFEKYLVNQGITPKVIFGNFGQHEQVYRLKQVANIILEQLDV